MKTQQKFPDDFLWGASTASHQVEGGTVNQWSAWELANAAGLADGAERRLHHLPDWKAIRDQAEDPDNYVSGRGVDHYDRYEEDFDLLQELGFNSFRFGVEWSRIEPEEGVFDAAAIKHYHDYIDSLLSRGVTPLLNIWHWTMPTWFTDKGGFERKDNLPLFDAFVTKIAEEYGDKLKYIITLNEPNVYASLSYLSGEWPPQQKSPRTFLTVYRNLAAAHRRAYAILKAVNPALQVGIAANLSNIQPKRPNNILDGIVGGVAAYGWNWWFLNRIRRQQDFVGVNYYMTHYYRTFRGEDNPQVPLNDLGWYMEPEGLYPLLKQVSDRYRRPVIITENGVADRDDQYRDWWLEQTVVAMQRALSDGVDLKGYMHWSLLDNFEWAYGWWPKFGLISVDRTGGMKRTPRPSAWRFSAVLAGLRGIETSTVAGSKYAAPPVLQEDRPRHQPAASGEDRSERRPAHPAASLGLKRRTSDDSSGQPTATGHRDHPAKPRRPGSKLQF